MLELRPGKFIYIPLAMVALAAKIGALISHALLDPATWQMLRCCNTSASDNTMKLLKRKPRAVMSWQMIILRCSLAAVWLKAGIVSAGIYSVDKNYALLERTGITGRLATWTLYSVAIVDIYSGLAT